MTRYSLEKENCQSFPNFVLKFMGKTHEKFMSFSVFLFEQNFKFNKIFLIQN